MATCPACGTENPERFNFCGRCGTKIATGHLFTEERKVVTILFCDLVMFTQRSETLDPEDVRAFLLPYYEVLTAEITRHGGTIDKFLGDGVMAVFGAPVAHEDDPERAVRTALQVLERTPDLGLDLHARIGINTGEVVVAADAFERGDAITGDVANTASRLQAAAPIDGVVVGEATYRATSHLFDYQVLDPVTVKGKAEPVAIYRPTAALARIGRAMEESTPFVGRDVELESLIRLFDRSRTSSSTEFVTIVAEPGLGKSRLVRELAHHVDALPELVTWRVGHCLPYGDGISFWALGEIIKAHAGILDTDDQATLSAKLDRVLVGSDPSLRSWMKDRIAPLVGLETTTEPPQQEEAFTAWRRFLEQIAADRPTVLVVEDLHWADDAFVRFLEHLCEHAVDLPLLVVVTARPEVTERHPGWLGDPDRTELALASLADDDIHTLVESVLEGASPALVATVLERAGGSPLYAEQLAAMLGEQAMPIAGGSLDESAIPPTVQALLAARIDALPQELKAVLLDASVVGKTFWSGAVSALGTHHSLEDHLAELARRRFIHPGVPSAMEGEDEFTFWHALVRDVAYGELPRAARMTKHRATAAWITDRAGEALGEDAEIVVAHLDRALELAEAAKANDEVTEIQAELVDALDMVASYAMRSEPSRAAASLRRAIHHSDGRARRSAELQARLGEALAAVGEVLDARDAFERAADTYRALGDEVAAVALAPRIASMCYSAGDYDSRDRLIAGALPVLRANPGRGLLDALHWAATIAIEQGRNQDALDVAEEIFAVADDVGASPAEAFETRGFIRRCIGDLAGSESDLQQAITSAEAAGDPRTVHVSYFYLALLREIGDGPVSAIDVAREGIAYGEAHGLATHFDRAHLADFLIEAGDWDEASVEANVAREQASAVGHDKSRFYSTASLAYVQVSRGQRTPACGWLMDFARSGVDATSGVAQIAARDALLAGDAVSARVYLSQGLDDDGEVENLADFVRACIAADALDLADRALAHGCPPDAQDPELQQAAAEAAVAESRDIMGLARARYQVALEAAAAKGFVIDMAYALAGLGRCLIALGETDAGVAKLKESRELWRGMKAVPRIAEIDELLETVT